MLMYCFSLREYRSGKENRASLKCVVFISGRTSSWICNFILPSAQRVIAAIMHVCWAVLFTYINGAKGPGITNTYTRSVNTVVLAHPKSIPTPARTKPARNIDKWMLMSGQVISCELSGYAAQRYVGIQITPTEPMVSTRIVMNGENIRICGTDEKIPAIVNCPPKVGQWFARRVKRLCSSSYSFNCQNGFHFCQITGKKKPALHGSGPRTMKWKLYILLFRDKCEERVWTGERV